MPDETPRLIELSSAGGIACSTAVTGSDSSCGRSRPVEEDMRRVAIGAPCQGGKRLRVGVPLDQQCSAPAARARSINLPSSTGPIPLPISSGSTNNAMSSGGPRERGPRRRPRNSGRSHSVLNGGGPDAHSGDGSHHRARNVYARNRPISSVRLPRSARPLFTLPPPRVARSQRRPSATPGRHGANRRRASRRPRARSESVLSSPPQRRRDPKDEDQLYSILQRDLTGLGWPRKAHLLGLGRRATKAKAFGR